MSYSTEHMAAFRKYEAAGWSLESLDETELAALVSEDPAFGGEVRKERERRVSVATPTATPPRSPATDVCDLFPIASLDARDAEDAEPLKQWMDVNLDKVPTVGVAIAVALRWTNNLRHFVHQSDRANKARNVRLDALDAQVKALAQERSGKGSDTRLIKLEVLEQRVKDLEARPPLEYHGVWAEGRPYEKNACVTHDGGMWIALCPTDAKPGTDAVASRAWQLAVKQGREGRCRCAAGGSR